MKEAFPQEKRIRRLSIAMTALIGGASLLSPILGVGCQYLLEAAIGLKNIPNEDPAKKYFKGARNYSRAVMALGLAGSLWMSGNGWGLLVNQSVRRGIEKGSAYLEQFDKK